MDNEAEKIASPLKSFGATLNGVVKSVGFPVGMPMSKPAEIPPAIPGRSRDRRSRSGR